MTNPTVHRIQFGKIVLPGPSTCCGDTGHVMGFGKKPAGARKFLSLVGGQEDPVFRQLKEGMGILRSNRLPANTLYSENDPAVVAFTSALAHGTVQGDLYALIERLIDTRPDLMIDTPSGQRIVDLEFEVQHPRPFESGYHFRLDSEFHVPDILPTAAVLLNQSERRFGELGSGAELIMQAHITEPYILAVSVLRHFGYDAYPAQAVVPNNANTVRFHPIITVIDQDKEYPLTTFDLLRIHPPMGSIDIISDVAMVGATYAALAEARVRHLTVEMLRQHKEGRELSMDELTNQLRRIADVLFEAHKRWPGCHYISNALVYAFEDFSNTLFTINHANLQAELVKTQQSGKSLGFDLQATVGKFAVEARITAERFANFVRSVLAQKIDQYEATSK
ncbi:MAG: hypothetical protein ABH842_03770 [Candidatus Micrarchaeota archaeon]